MTGSGPPPPNGSSCSTICMAATLLLNVPVVLLFDVEGFRGGTSFWTPARLQPRRRVVSRARRSGSAGSPPAQQQGPRQGGRGDVPRRAGSIPHLGVAWIMAAIFATLLVLLAPGTDRTLAWPAACGAYTAAWLAGFVTPGAPAGLGVRELVLVFLLDGHAAEPDLLPAVVLSRVVTVLGDTFFFGAAAWAGRRAGPDR